MPRRIARDREVPALQNQMLACVDADAVESCILHPLRRSLGANTSTLLAFRHDGGGEISLPASWSHALPAAVHQAYHQRLYRDDPMVRTHLAPAMRAEAGHVPVQSFAVSDLETVGRRPSRRYMQEFWAGNQLRHMAGLTVHPTPDSPWWVVLALHRFDGEDPFEAADVAALEGLAGAARAVFHALTADMEARRAAEAAAALDRCMGPNGLVLLQPDGRILHETPAARRQWTADEAVRARVLSEATRGEGTRSFVLPGRDEKKLRFVAQGPGGPGEPLLIFSGRTLEEGGAAAACARLGLTSRETDIALAAIDGLSNEDMGALFGISVRTVENHLRAIFDKAGVENRTRLARLLLSPRG